MIQPDTISSLAAEDKVPETSSTSSSQPSSLQDAVVPSISASQGKKLSCKTNQSDRVLAYLASVGTFQGVTCTFILFCVMVYMSVQCTVYVTLQDKAAADAQKENSVYKRQLIGLLAKVQTAQ